MDAFVCRQCGTCCRVRGYVRLRADEIDAIAAHLGMDVHEFTRDFTAVMRGREGLTLIEKEGGSCILLEENGRCLVHAVKPRQCRGFPLDWSYADFEKTCEGMKART
jgi:uncharacterized protein